MPLLIISFDLTLDDKSVKQKASMQQAENELTSKLCLLVLNGGSAYLTILYRSIKIFEQALVIKLATKLLLFIHRYALNTKKYPEYMEQEVREAYDALKTCLSLISLKHAISLLYSELRHYDVFDCNFFICSLPHHLQAVSIARPIP